MRTVDGIDSIKSVRENKLAYCIFDVRFARSRILNAVPRDRLESSKRASQERRYSATIESDNQASDVLGVNWKEEKEGDSTRLYTCMTLYMHCP
jgi:hypothetical protein